MDHSVFLVAADAALTTKLATLLPILDAFNHRHRNQHSASHWWSAFTLLRRGARSLAADLRRHQALSRLQTDSSNKSTAAKTKSKTAKKQLLARVTLLRDHTVPKAYLCFSQLIADNQHATLGLLLMSALASVNSTLTSISPPPQEPALRPSAASSPLPDTHPTDSKSKHKQSQLGHDSNIDRGVAVSRDRITGVVSKSSKPFKPPPNEDAAAKDKHRNPVVPSIKQSDDRPNKKKAKKKKGKGDELSNLFGSL
ncbi:uncharacterized protein BBA_06397 [Beauveria bassiana ARSEF 2860]|uniref:RNase MRP protein 1 RNA binding domain-containing protein n=1 Tax=Beauveria bassiana (strain ARSEF 2860) TaxID=655819 RepID=J5JGJ8_BEAB2|nr:uncharacterized protein BBA_06397 [Beauveria bassiana ARSEF 2860]EJP64828.1 hypothetical protein BBA_06397 [Beauveria bassiana ARSEF 2860]